MPRLSVIVPIYNVEAYLPACIESILGQSLQDLELILIDDGSPDRCGTICDKYAAGDSRVRVIHQTNHGVSSARNAGLRIACGDYYGFVDPDDFVEPEMYEKLISAAEESRAEIAVCGFSYCAEDGIINRWEPIRPGDYSQKELFLSIYGMPNFLHGSMCNKVFSKRILEQAFFDEKVSIGEDWLLLYACYERTHHAVVIEDCCYTIRVRENSATRKRNAQLYMKKLETYEKLFHYAENKDKEIRCRAAEKILDTYLNNKNDIRVHDYNRKSIMSINQRMIKSSISSFLRGNLPVKRMLYYMREGFRN